MHLPQRSIAVGSGAVTAIERAFVAYYCALFEPFMGHQHKLSNKWEATGRLDLALDEVVHAMSRAWDSSVRKRTLPDQLTVPIK